MSEFDLVITGGTVVAAGGTGTCDIGISGGRIETIGTGLGPARRTIDATDRLVLPGGVDSHCHIEQLSASGLVNSDTFETATRAAAAGGTTTVIPFAAQYEGMSLARVVGDYHALAEKGAIVDYALHMIIAGPSRAVLDEELPALVASGHSSIKMFMTYDRLRLDDAQMLEVLAKARDLGAFVMVHAENHAMIVFMVNRLIERGATAPKYHAVSHPRAGEAEAFTRLIAMSELIDQPVMIFHVSSAGGAGVIGAARARGVKLFAETCTQYLLLTAGEMDKPGIEGAKWICSPPLRTRADQDALWAALKRGDLQTVTSDHAPYSFDRNGKLTAGPNPGFKQIPNGMPGIQWRLPVLFDAMVSSGRMSLEDFVRLTSTASAEIYGLAPRKGRIVPGADADLVIWDASREVTLTDAMVNDGAGYNPYAGRTITGWPQMVIRRGELIAEDGRVSARPGSGMFLARAAGEAARPSGRRQPEFDPALNFGADIA
jgi:dihydropyrimidinase